MRGIRGRPCSESLHSTLLVAGQDVVGMPYVAREHPDGMKLQSLPFGFDADDRVLQETLGDKYAAAAAEATPGKSKSGKKRSAHDDDNEQPASPTKKSASASDSKKAGKPKTKKK
ncbi:hypothetical protein BC831DRAFT_513665 [Entophlyctis helioformis]|nr:hypothetical protein BC831DRAFT_513665 [Entophlyctis helioformis]